METILSLKDNELVWESEVHEGNGIHRHKTLSHDLGRIQVDAYFDDDNPRDDTITVTLEREGKPNYDRTSFLDREHVRTIILEMACWVIETCPKERK